jgi:hypothetical protein
VGRKHSEETFGRLIPRRTLLVNRHTLLTLTRPDDSEASATEAKAATAAFAAL